MAVNKRAKVVTVVQVKNKKYGPGKAQQAASEWAGYVALDFWRRARAQGKTFRDFNDYHRVAFYRSLSAFERVLGPAKNRKNPRMLYHITTNPVSVTVVQN